jgi:hypothetical protein
MGVKGACPLGLLPPPWERGVTLANSTECLIQMFSTEPNHDQFKICPEDLKKTAPRRNGHELSEFTPEP